jgi:hypothetical protein
MEYHKTGKKKEKSVYRLEIQTYWKTDRQTDKESQTAGKQAVRQTDTQKGRQKDS